MANIEIREAAKEAGVKLWEVAQIYGICDCNFSRKLRCELPATEKEKILTIIKSLAEKKRVEV